MSLSREAVLAVLGIERWRERAPAVAPILAEPTGERVAPEVLRLIHPDTLSEAAARLLEDIARALQSAPLPMERVALPAGAALPVGSEVNLLFGLTVVPGESGEALPALDALLASPERKAELWRRLRPLVATVR